MMQKRAQSGYTLIQIAIAVGVIGVLIGSAGEMFTLYQKSKREVVTVENTKRVTKAMISYLTEHGRYPRPAQPDAAREAATYGMEMPAPGSPPTVLQGTIPFRVLGLPEYMSEDGYLNRLNYAVTYTLTTTAYSNNGGAITVNDSTGTAISSKVHFIVFSSGEDKVGAYTHEGAQPLACDGTVKDGENCNNDATFAFMTMARGDGPGHFDDFVGFQAQADTPFWLKSANSNDDVYSAVGAVGIGTTPDPGIALQVRGDARTSGKIFASQICDLAGNCFDVAKVATAPTATTTVSCANGIKGFKQTATGTDIDCGPGGTNIQCPTGQVIKGMKTVDGNRVPVCGLAAEGLGSSYCAQTKMPLCAKDNATPSTTEYVTLAQSLDGAILTGTSMTYPTYSETYQCQRGNWVKTASAGTCGTLPTRAIREYTAASWLGGPGKGWTGMVKVLADGTIDPSSSYTCVPGATESFTQSCDGGTSYAATRTWACDSATAGHWDNSPGSCTNTSTDTSICPPGMTGTPPACAGTPKMLRPRACAAGMLGMVTDTLTKAAATDATWATTGGATTSCSVAVTTIWKKPSTQTGGTGALLGTSAFTASGVSAELAVDYGLTGNITVGTAKGFYPGQRVTLTNSGGATMSGLVKSYRTDQLNVSIDTISDTAQTPLFTPLPSVTDTWSVAAEPGVLSRDKGDDQSVFVYATGTTPLSSVNSASGITPANVVNITPAAAMVGTVQGPYYFYNASTAINNAGYVSRGKRVTLVCSTTGKAAMSGAAYGIGTISGFSTAAVKRISDLYVAVDSVTDTTACNSWILRFEREPYQAGEYCATTPAALHRSCYAPAGKNAQGQDMYYQYKDCVCQ